MTGFEYEAIAMYEHEAAQEYRQKRDELLRCLHSFLTELARRRDQLNFYEPDMTRTGYRESMESVVGLRARVVREIQRLNTETPDVIRRLADLRVMPETRAEYEQELARFRREHWEAITQVQMDEAYIMQRIQNTERAMGPGGGFGADVQDLRMIRPGAR